jgi:hypothetical protein
LFGRRHGGQHRLDQTSQVLRAEQQFRPHTTYSHDGDNTRDSGVQEWPQRII